MHKLLPFLICVVIVSCGRSAQQQYMIGVSQCSNDEWRDKMNNEMHREAMLSHEISLEIRSAGGDNEIQCASRQTEWTPEVP